MSLVVELRDRLERLEGKLDAIAGGLAELRAGCEPCRATMAAHDRELNGDNGQGLRTRVVLLEESRSRQTRWFWLAITTAAGLAGSLVTAVARALWVILCLLLLCTQICAAEIIEEVASSAGHEVRTKLTAGEQVWFHFAVKPPDVQRAVNEQEALYAAARTTPTVTVQMSPEEIARAQKALDDLDSLAAGPWKRALEAWPTLSYTARIELLQSCPPLSRLIHLAQRLQP